MGNKGVRPDGRGRFLRGPVRRPTADQHWTVRLRGIDRREIADAMSAAVLDARLAASAERYPTRIAVVDRGRQSTYAALDAEKTADVEFDEHESVVTLHEPLAEIPALIKSGAITHSLVVAAFQYFSYYRAEGSE